MEPSNHVNKSRQSILHPRFIVLSKRGKHIGIAVQPKVGGCYSNNGVGFSIVGKRHTQSNRIAAIPSRPQPRADDRDGYAAKVFLIRDKRTTLDQADAQYGKQ